MSDTINKEAALASLSLGKPTHYSDTYSADLLQAVPRALNRQELNLSYPLPFSGSDRWNGYELSWLNVKGKPQVAILRCEVPATSPNLIESKSFKLYLNSYNQTQFTSIEQVQASLQQDLSDCAGEKVKVEVLAPSSFSGEKMIEFAGQSIDELDIDINHYQLDLSYLSSQGPIVEETLTSDLLKSNCLITNQPDWGSVLVRYQGPQITHEGLLRYLISFRQHNEFHEQCVERIFCDIMRQCHPQKLTVYARYTRRGGLDINPFRSNFEKIYPELRLARQ